MGKQFAQTVSVAHLPGECAGVVKLDLVVRRVALTRALQPHSKQRTDVFGEAVVADPIKACHRLCLGRGRR